MRRSAVQIYALAVCFTTLMCFVIALGWATYDAIRFAAPAFTLSAWQMYESNEPFLQYWPDKKELPEAELSRARQAAYEGAIAGERHAAAQSGVFVTIILLIDVAVYVVHWRIARRLEASLEPAVTRAVEPGATRE